MTISRELWYKIFLLHKEIGDIEWSGIMFYEVNGTITDPESLHFICKDILLMDIGNSVHTEYKFSEEVMDIYDLHPEYMDENIKIGHLHSHHKMNVFFSGEDTSALEENIPFHNYFLSVIVNKDGSIAAKTAFEITVTPSASRFDDNGKQIIIPLPEEKKMGIIDMTTHVEEDEFLMKKIIELKEKKRVIDQSRAVVKYAGSKVEVGPNGYPKEWDKKEPKRWQEEDNYSNIDDWNEYQKGFISDTIVTDAEIERFLSKLISMDLGCKDYLGKVIKNQNNKFPKGQAEILVHQAISIFDDVYLNVFNDPSYDGEIAVINKAIKRLASFNDTISRKLIELFKKRIKTHEYKSNSR